MNLKELTQEIVKELVTFFPETGKYIWNERDKKWFTDGYRDAQGNVNIWNSLWAGKEAFTADNGEGYLCGAILGIRIKAHRLAFFYMIGEWPEQVDHIDGNRSNNVFKNLRSVTKAQNAKNQKKHVTNTSGVSGVSWRKSSGTWVARIHDNNERYWLGTSESFEEACEMRRKAEIEFNYAKEHGTERPHYPKANKEKAPN